MTRQCAAPERQSDSPARGATVVPPTAAVAVLDEFLLAGLVTRAHLEDAIAAIRLSGFRRHLVLTGLDTGLPCDDTVMEQSLLRLRVLFTDLLEPSDDLVRTLDAVRSLHRLIRTYVLAETDLNQFRRSFTALQTGTPNALLGRVRHELAYRLAIAGAPEAGPSEVWGTELLACCIRTLGRLAAFWHSVLGG